MIYFIIPASIILFFYGIFIIIFMKGWMKIKPFYVSDFKEFIKTSVIIPFRNEEANLPVIIRCLEKQNYPDAKFEVLFINDHSTDNSENSLKKNISDNIKFKILNLPNNLNGKKAAIDYGIKNCLGELILLTDADCILPEKWIYSFVNYYIVNNKPDFIIGMLDMNTHNKNLFYQFQTLEFLSLIVSGISAAGAGYPIYCNGANLFFTKTLYFKYHDPLNKDVISGDDTFFLHQVKKDKTTKILVLKSIDATVSTNPQKSFRDLIRQRIRWGSKSTKYKDRDTIAAAVVVFFINILLLLSLILFFIYNSLIYLIPFILKSVLDGIYLLRILRYYKKIHVIWYLPFFEAINSVFVFMTAILSFVKKKVIWKNRKISF